VGREAVAVGDGAEDVGLALVPVLGGREELGADDAGVPDVADGDSATSGALVRAEGDVPSGPSGEDGDGACSPPDSAAIESIASAPATATAPTP
jgi:hypothetical protein